MKFENHQYNNAKILLDDGREYSIFANWIHNQKLDYFKGWYCEAGITRLSIDTNGNVYSGECKDSRLGNLDTGWQLLNEETAHCKRDRCTGCTDDLIVKKYQK